MILLWCAPSLAQCLIAKCGEPNFAVSKYYGYRVEISGDRALVSGSLIDTIYAYERQGPQWIPTVALPAPGFYEPALDGNTAMVGDYNYGGEYGYGLVKVLEHDGNQWNVVAELEPLDKYDGNWFGWSIALEGHVAVIGAVRYDTGKAYIFERDGSGTWKQTAKLSPPPPYNGYFGWSVATDGQTAVVGSIYDHTLGFSSGAAYVYERDGAGAWTKSSAIYASDAKGYDNFGQKVLVRDDMLLVSAPGSDVGGVSKGAVFEFRRQPGGTWQEVAKIIASDGQLTDGFGRGMGLDGDILVVGASASSPKGVSSGSAYVLLQEGIGNWKEVAKLVPPDGRPWDHFGEAVAVSGNIAVIGMWQQKPDPPWQPGFARFYAVGPDMNGNGLMDPCECPGDLDKNWIVNQSDLAWLLAYWGKCRGDPGFKPEFDLNASGCIDQGDLGVVLANYGNVCP